MHRKNSKGQAEVICARSFLPFPPAPPIQSAEPDFTQLLTDTNTFEPLQQQKQTPGSVLCCHALLQTNSHQRSVGKTQSILINRREDQLFYGRTEFHVEFYGERQDPCLIPCSVLKQTIFDASASTGLLPSTTDTSFRITD